nr:CBO0543 family protein [Evansella caseinilytica]
MYNKTERKILKVLIIIGLILTPLSFIGKNFKNWMIVFLLNSYANIFSAPVLQKKGYLRYPTRLLPKYYQSSIIYDYCLCSLMTLWLCRTTANDTWKGWKKLVLKIISFIIPQVIFESWLERNTKLVSYKKGWTWLHSFITMFTLKFSIRNLIYLLDKWSGKDEKQLKQEKYLM